MHIYLHLLINCLCFDYYLWLYCWKCLSCLILNLFSTNHHRSSCFSTLLEVSAVSAFLCCWINLCQFYSQENGYFPYPYCFYKEMLSWDLYLPCSESTIEVVSQGNCCCSNSCYYGSLGFSQRYLGYYCWSCCWGQNLGKS